MTGLLSIPSAVRLILGGVKNPVIATVYINEKKIDFSNKLLHESSHHKPQYSYNWKFNLIDEAKEYQFFRCDISKIPSQKKFPPNQGIFFLLYDKETYILFIFCAGGKSFINHCVHSFIEDLFYPNISRAYLTSQEIFEVLNKFERSSGKKLLCRNSSGKSPFSKNPQRINPETVMRYGRGHLLSHYVDHFTKARSEEKRINWLELENEPESKKIIKFDISRECNIAMYEGGHEFYFQLLLFIAEKGLIKSGWLSNLAIQNKKIITLVFDFDSELLNNPTNRELFIKEIQSYPYSTYSIVHGTNPHIFAYIIDRLDNTSFSIKNLGFHQIIITPQVSSNYGSLLRFINYLVEHFTEFREMRKIET